MLEFRAEGLAHACSGLRDERIAPLQLVGACRCVIPLLRHPNRPWSLWKPAKPRALGNHGCDLGEHVLRIDADSMTDLTISSMLKEMYEQ